MNNSSKEESIVSGSTSLGIELGSTRIKAVLIDEGCSTLATGSHEWENQFIDGVWTYDLEDVWMGLQKCYADLKKSVKENYGVKLTKVAALGLSGMMHGYLAFDQSGDLLVPFRTWRNNICKEASESLMKAFDYPIPQRWTIAHIYQAILNQEEHVSDLGYVTSLAGYLHWQLTGHKVIGVGEASGMFPVDTHTLDYDSKMMKKFDTLIEMKAYKWKIKDVLPEVMVAGELAGRLSEMGAKQLDPSGDLAFNIPMCPPEGDAATGMVATNSVAKCTGNVSAGTSIFAMVVLEDNLSKVYPQIDLITTPTGKLVALVHSNNGTSNLDKWVTLFGESINTFGFKVDKNTLYETLYKKALEGDPDCGGLLSYGYLSGEHMTNFEDGRPLLTWSSESHFNLANVMRAHLYTSMGALSIGLELLFQQENVKLDRLFAHGGLFKVPDIGQRFMAAAVNAPVAVMDNVGEGGPWGMAILAAYTTSDKSTSFEVYLKKQVFLNQSSKVIEPSSDDIKGFGQFMKRYKEGLPIERAAVDCLKRP